MAPTVKTWIIVNPKAGSGRASSAGRGLFERLPDAHYVETRAPGEAEVLARQARESGALVVVPVGGDGTIQQCITGLCLDEHGTSVKSETALSLCPAGTGGDYRKTFDFTESLDAAVTRIRAPKRRRIDVGLVTFHSTLGAKHQVAFANVLSMGLGGLTDQLVERGPKWLGGKAAFLLGALKATMVHQPAVTELTLDGAVIETAPFSNIAVCVGRYFGGGMLIAPGADPSDGLFDVVTIEMSKLKTASLSAHIYRGTHLGVRGVNHYRCKTMSARVTGHGTSLIDVDGEQLGSLPLSVSILPSALELCV